MRQIKFRARINNKKDWHYFDLRDNQQVKDLSLLVAYDLSQFTGLLDKHGLQEVYECDIIDEYGNIKGSTYEMDKGETDLVIEGFGTSSWSKTEMAGLGRGLKYSK